MHPMRFLTVILLIVSFSVSAQVYKWTDAAGTVHFGSQPPPGEQQEIHVRKSSPGAFGAETRGRTFELEQRLNRIESANVRESSNAPVYDAPAAPPGPSRACSYAHSVLQSYENSLKRLLKQGYKQRERQRAENRVAEWKDQVNISCQ